MVDGRWLMDNEKRKVTNGHFGGQTKIKRVKGLQARIGGPDFEKQAPDMISSGAEELTVLHCAV